MAFSRVYRPVVLPRSTPTESVSVPMPMPMPVLLPVVDHGLTAGGPVVDHL